MSAPFNIEAYSKCIMAISKRIDAEKGFDAFAGSEILANTFDTTIDDAFNDIVTYRKTLVIAGYNDE
jgi:hypothetical protein